MPFSYTKDGEFIRVFVRKLLDGNLVIHDGGGALRHLESMRCRVTDSRMEKIRSLLRDPVVLSERGEITANCQVRQASLVLPEVIGSILLVNYVGELWSIRR